MIGPLESLEILYLICKLYSLMFQCNLERLAKTISLYKYKQQNIDWRATVAFLVYLCSCLGRCRPTSTESRLEKSPQRICFGTNSPSANLFENIFYSQGLYSQAKSRGEIISSHGTLKKNISSGETCFNKTKSLLC